MPEPIVAYGRARRNGRQHDIATPKLYAEPPESPRPSDRVISRGREMLDIVCEAAGLANDRKYSSVPRKLINSLDDHKDSFCPKREREREAMRRANK